MTGDTKTSLLIIYEIVTLRRTKCVACASAIRDGRCADTFGTVIPKSFNILLLLSCITAFSLYRNCCMPYYLSIKAYNSTVQEF